MRPQRLDLNAAMRADQNRWDSFVSEREALARRLREEPRVERTRVEAGVDPHDLADLIEQKKRERTPVIAILAGRREWKALCQEDGAADYREYWPGGEETFAGAPLIIRKGAGAARVFTDLRELDGAVNGLPETMTPPMRR